MPPRRLSRNYLVKTMHLLFCNYFSIMLRKFFPTVKFDIQLYFILIYSLSKLFLPTLSLKYTMSYESNLIIFPNCYLVAPYYLPNALFSWVIWDTTKSLSVWTVSFSVFWMVFIRDWQNIARIEAGNGYMGVYYRDSFPLYLKFFSNRMGLL